MQRLVRVVFSFLLFSVIAYSCKYPKSTADCLITNHFSDSVEVTIFSDDKDFQSNYCTRWKMASNDTIKLATLSTNDRGGIKLRRYINRMDSVSVRLINGLTPVITWRNNLEYTIAQGFETVPDWYDLRTWEEEGFYNTDRNDDVFRYVLTK